MIEVSVNGERRQLTAATTIAAALASWNYDGDCVAVAINSEFVPRADYAVRQFAAGDRIDVVAPVAGG